MKQSGMSMRTSSAVVVFAAASLLTACGTARTGDDGVRMGADSGTGEGGAAEDGGSTDAGIRYTVPSAPQNLIASAGAASVTLSWSTPADAGGGVTSYGIVYSKTGSPEASLTATTSAVIISGLQSNDVYTFSVSAMNPAGSSPASTVYATPF